MSATLARSIDKAADDLLNAVAACRDAAKCARRDAESADGRRFIERCLSSAYLYSANATGRLDNIHIAPAPERPRATTTEGRS